LECRDPGKNLHASRRRQATDRLKIEPECVYIGHHSVLWRREIVEMRESDDGESDIPQETTSLRQNPAGKSRPRH